MTRLKELLKNASISFMENMPVSQKSTFRIGSTAAIFTAPENIDIFHKTIDIVKSSGVQLFVLGGGSNIVFPDEQFKGIIVSTENLKLVEKVLSKKTNPTENKFVYVRCQSGTPMSTFVNFCTENCLSGAEEFAGLPGSVGGALFMNARCFNKSVSEIFFNAEYLDMKEKDYMSQTKEINFIPTEWAYKKSPFQSKEGSQKGSSAEDAQKYITEVTFKLKQMPATSKTDIEMNCKKYISERISKGHFKYPSAGSVFKNNRAFGKPSGQLIDEAGLKGFSSGGAQIASFHGNFIINVNKATAKDVNDIIRTTQKVVKDKFGFLLEPEIIFLKNIEM